jgi:hypothetical protein
MSYIKCSALSNVSANNAVFIFRMNILANLLFESLAYSRHSEDLGADGRIIFKWALKKEVTMV